MIIARYLNKQILLVSSAITFFLLMIVVLSRILKYLTQASQGELDSSVLLLLMFYRLPEYLPTILPLALLLGILLAYGRMYSENEMTVLIACGVSRFKLFCITLLSALVVGLVVAILVLKVTPWGLVNAGALLETQKNLNEFDVMVPGIFQNISRGARTTYTQSMVGDEMHNVFMVERESNRVTVAEIAIPVEDENGGRFVLFKNGTITEGVPGSDDYTLTEFEELGVVIPQREIALDFILKESAMSTAQLFGSDDNAHKAELQWRFSLILLIPILTLLAVSLSKVDPRQGRFGKLAPAIVIYILYFGLLTASKDMVSDGELSAAVGLWWVHLLFFALGLLLFFEKLPSFSAIFSVVRVFSKK